jgi:membrane protease YdiL (CAAX protease family)
MKPEQGKAWLALALLLPAPTIGTAMMLLVWPDQRGKIIAFACKAWLLLLPLVWHAKVDRLPLRFPKPSMRGMGMAVASGAFVFIVILAAFKLMQSQIPLEPLRAKAAETGFNDPGTFAAMFAYIILVNALLEEYVWRWFVFSKFEVATGSGRIAVALAAIGFTIHHIFALMAWVPPLVNVVAATGVCVGGAIWSWLYLRYRSVWPCYVSHICADVAIMLIGIELIFG